MTINSNIMLNYKLPLFKYDLDIITIFTPQVLDRWSNLAGTAWVVNYRPSLGERVSSYE